MSHKCKCSKRDEVCNKSINKCCCKLEKLINRLIPCPPTPISNVPAIINEPGVYCLTQNVTFDGTGSAITITCNDVILDLNSHNITVNQDTSNGIFVNAVTSIVIKNGSIRFAGNPTTATDGASIHIEDATDVDVSNVFERGFFNGILILSSNHVHLAEVHLEENINSNTRIRGGSGIIIHDSYARNSLFPGGTLSGGFNVAARASIPASEPRDIELFNIETVNSDYFIQEGININARNLNSYFEDPDYVFSMFQLGASTFEEPLVRSVAHNVILKDSTFLNRNANPFAKGVQISSAIGVIIDGITVNIDSQGTGLPTEEAGIKLVIGAEVNSGLSNFVDTVVVRNSVFTSPKDRPSGHGVSIFGDTGFLNRSVTLENNTITNQLASGIIVGNSRGTILKGNTVSNSEIAGIDFVANSDGSVLVENIVQFNANGIRIASNKNIIKENIVTNNTVAVIINTGANNILVNNLDANNL